MLHCLHRPLSSARRVGTWVLSATLLASAGQALAQTADTAADPAPGGER
jgi:hypothetical protein